MAFRVVASVAHGKGWQRAAAAAAAVSALLRLALAPLAIVCVMAGPGKAQPVLGEVTVSTADGFARLLFRFQSEVGVNARLANNIIVITFEKAVDINVERLNTSAPSYISASRLDPDGLAVRIALAQQVKANLTPASERVFLDLLPTSWTGLVPGLPKEVIEDLTRRTREAERRARIQQQLAGREKIEPVRVRVAEQPTFVRYTIPLPNAVAVAADRGQNGLTLVFDAPLRFDFADALAAPPPYIASIEPKLDEDAASVQFAFNGKVDVRTFREDNNYVVDVSATDMSRSSDDAVNKAIEELKLAKPAREAATQPMRAPETVPAAPPAAAAATPDPPRAAAPVREVAQPAMPAMTSPAAAPAPAPAQERVVPSAPAAAQPRSADARKPAARETMPAAMPSPMPPTAQQAANSVKPDIKRTDKSVRILFPFAAPTPAAVFRRADVMWLVFDSEAPIDAEALGGQSRGMIRDVHVSHAGGQVIRLKLDRPRLADLVMEGTSWAVTLGDTVTEPSAPIEITRTVIGQSRGAIIIPFEDAGRLHRIVDPEVGDVLLVVSALGPVRGILKPQEFVELRALTSTHGVAVQPLADDVIMQVGTDRIVIGRPEGLALSSFASGGGKDRDAHTLFNIERWTRDREGNFYSDQLQLINNAIEAPADQRSVVHRQLGRFYMAREMYHEAKGALDMALSGEHPKEDEAAMYVLRAVAQLMIGRTKEALSDLAHPTVSNQHDAPLWRALAYALDGKWAEARAGFQSAKMSIGTLPFEMQRFVLQTSIRAAIEAGDIDAAASELNDLETIGTSPEQKAAMAVLRGRIAEKLGRIGDAVAAYQEAVDSSDRRAAAYARLRLALLKMASEEVKRADGIAEVETVSVVWRGDRTEIEALHALARLYTEDGRLREAFGVMRTALAANSRSELTRSIQEEAAATFESLFLSGKGEKLPAIDALSLFYDFRELTPMGRRGDEMIRRLADRLVAVDLLDQAAELLQHQVNKRLQGAARGQVAARLAMIYLMNNKADRALAVLRTTHVAGFSNTLRNRRLMLESRALSDLGRPDVALEIVANIGSKEADRLRGDILWKARRWREAAERIEATLGDRWRDFNPLSAIERNDVLRAAIGYALAEDSLGAGRLRERYAAKMADSSSARAFDIVSIRARPTSAEFRAVAASVASVDSLEGFLRDMREGFGDLADKPKGAQQPPDLQPAAPAPASTTGQGPAASASPEAVPATPATAPAVPEAAPAAAR